MWPQLPGPPQTNRSIKNKKNTSKKKENRNNEYYII